MKSDNEMILNFEYNINERTIQFSHAYGFEYRLCFGCSILDELIGCFQNYSNLNRYLSHIFSKLGMTELYKARPKKVSTHSI